MIRERDSHPLRTSEYVYVPAAREFHRTTPSGDSPTPAQKAITRTQYSDAVIDLLGQAAQTLPDNPTQPSIVQDVALIEYHRVTEAGTAEAQQSYDKRYAKMADVYRSAYDLVRPQIIEAKFNTIGEAGFIDENQSAPEIPHWKEAVLKLSPEQRFAAEVAFGVKLLQIANKQAQKDAHLYQQKGSEEGGFVQSVAAIIDLFQAKQDGPQAEQALRDQLGADMYRIEGKLSPYLAYLELSRDRIYDEAKDWNARDIEKINQGAKKVMVNLPKEERIHLLERAGFVVNHKITEAGKHAITIGANIASSHALEGAAIAVGTIAAAANPFAHADNKLIAAAVFASYVVWMKELAQNEAQNWNLLEKTDISTSWTSKVLYDAAKKITDNKKVQRAAEAFGFTAWQAVAEIPWYISAFNSVFNVPDIASNATGIDPTNNKWSYIAGANIGAAAYNMLQGNATKKSLEIVQKNGTIFKNIKSKLGETIPVNWRNYLAGT